MWKEALQAHEQNQSGFLVKACTAGLQKSFTSGLIPGALLRIAQSGHIRGLCVHCIWLWHWAALTCTNRLYFSVLNIHFYHMETCRDRNKSKCCDRNSELRSGHVCRLYCILFLPWFGRRLCHAFQLAAKPEQGQKLQSTLQTHAVQFYLVLPSENKIAD